MNNYQLAVDMDKIISLLFDKLIDSWGRRNKVLCKKIAQVATYDEVADTATLYFAPDYSTQSCKYKIRTGVPLSPGNWVYLFFEFGNVSQGGFMKRSNDDLTPCGDDRLDCIDCCGYGVCELTKGEVDFDNPLTLEDVFKEVFGLDLDEVRKSF